MNTQLALVCLLTFIIHLISALSYALRIAGVRTGRWRKSTGDFIIEGAQGDESFGPVWTSRRVSMHYQE